MKKILSIFGTRPEAIKMAPVVKELEKHPSSMQSIVCVTAQHREMLDQVLEVFAIRPDYDLDLMLPGQDLFDITAKVLLGLKDVLTEVKPDIVLVHGDTTTAMAATLAAFYAHIPVGHVEAGLRSGNRRSPFPEEINRRVTDAVCDLHFAPTAQARQNLLAEGIRDETIHVTGNTVIDALFLVLDRIKNEKLAVEIERDLVRRYPRLSRVFPVSLDDDPQSNPARPEYILVTGHRRENFGRKFENICRAIHDISQAYPDFEIIYPVHLNPNVQEPVYRILADLPSVHLIEPQDYIPFVYLMDRSYLIITDSGGIQEEAPSLGKPVIVLRETTERPEAVLAGTVRLVGTDREKISTAVGELLANRTEYEKMTTALNPYGDGLAAARIQAILAGETIHTFIAPDEETKGTI